MISETVQIGLLGAGVSLGGAIIGWAATTKSTSLADKGETSRSHAGFVMNRRVDALEKIQQEIVKVQIASNNHRDSVMRYSLVDSLADKRSDISDLIGKYEDEMDNSYKNLKRVTKTCRLELEKSSIFLTE